MMSCLLGAEKLRGFASRVAGNFKAPPTMRSNNYGKCRSWMTVNDDSMCMFLSLRSQDLNLSLQVECVLSNVSQKIVMHIRSHCAPVENLPSLRPSDPITTRRRLQRVFTNLELFKNKILTGFTNFPNRFEKFRNPGLSFAPACCLH